MTLLLLLTNVSGAPPPTVIPQSFFMASISVEYLDSERYTNLLRDVFDHHFGLL